MREVELLRRAATLMRQRAERATPSPWGVGNDTNIVRGVEVTGPGSYTCIQSVAEVDDDRCDWDRDEAVEVEPEDDAEHIASWHPAVALAVADLMDHAAEVMERDLADVARRGAVNAEEFIAVLYEPSLRVAREYLREVTDAQDS